MRVSVSHSGSKEDRCRSLFLAVAIKRNGMNDIADESFVPRAHGECVFPENPTDSDGVFLIHNHPDIGMDSTLDIAMDNLRADFDCAKIIVSQYDDSDLCNVGMIKLHIDEKSFDIPVENGAKCAVVAVLRRDGIVFDGNAVENHEVGINQYMNQFE